MTIGHATTNTLTAPSGSPDVIVVGGGPAGAVAARTLARGGARVLVLDRARFPRNKPCGGGLTWRAIGRFPWLETLLPRISTHTVSRLLLESPSGEQVVIDAGQPTVLLVRRIEFDQLLMLEARRAGADLLEGVEILQAEQDDREVRLKARDGRVFSAPRVIAADGVHSVIAKRIGLNRAWPADAIALDMMEETPAEHLQATDRDTLAVFFGHGAVHGYGYIFPKKDHVNVGIGSLVDAFKSTVHEAPYDVQRQFVAWLRDRGLVSGESRRDTFTPYLVPIGGPLSQAGAGRVLLAGDAGGFVNGFSAEGIYFAMVTGELAARAMLDGGSPRRYERLWRRELGAELRDSTVLRRFVFAHAARADALIRGFRAFPEVQRLIVRYARGELNYASTRLRFLLHCPRIGAKLAASYFRPGRLRR